MRLDRIVVASYGRLVGLELPARLIDSALDRLPPGAEVTDLVPERQWSMRPQLDGGWAARQDERVIAVRRHPAELLDLLMGDLELWVAEYARGFIFVHAGAVALHGRAVVFPGRTRAGKSTLVLELVRAGASYLSDEYAVVDPTGVIYPYARRLSLRSEYPGAAARVDVADIGGRVAEAVPLGLVAHLRYAPGAIWQVDETSSAETFLALLGNTVAARARARETMDHLQAAMHAAAGVGGSRGEAVHAAQHIRELARTAWRTPSIDRFAAS